MINYINRPNLDSCKRIAQSLYGSIQKIEFTEKYVPEIERFEEPKVEVVSNYLNQDPSIKHLWAILDDNSKLEIGYILIADLPHENSIGYSIDVNYSNKGIMAKSLKLVLQEINLLNLPHPINVHTLIENEPSNRLLIRLGFTFHGKITDQIVGEHNLYSWL
jgi:RimJ/RimL family protein N-acetyltransferase